MAKALLVIDDAQGNPVLALGPDGLPIVFDPANGAGAECCCGGGGGPCTACFWTNAWKLSPRCFWPECEAPVTCCNFGANYTFEVFGQRTWVEDYPGNQPPTVTYFDRERRKFEFAWRTVNGVCRSYYRCLAREIYSTTRTGFNVVVNTDISTCADTNWHRDGEGDSAFSPHRVFCNSPLSAPSALFSLFGIAGQIFRDGPNIDDPNDVQHRCEGSHTRPINNNTGTQTTSWSVEIAGCFGGTAHSEVHSTSPIFGTVNAVADQWFQIVRLAPCFGGDVDTPCQTGNKCDPCGGGSPDENYTAQPGAVTPDGVETAGGILGRLL